MRVYMYELYACVYAFVHESRSCLCVCIDKVNVYVCNHAVYVCNVTYYE